MGTFILVPERGLAIYRDGRLKFKDRNDELAEHDNAKRDLSHESSTAGGVPPRPHHANALKAAAQRLDKDRIGSFRHRGSEGHDLFSV